MGKERADFAAVDDIYRDMGKHAELFDTSNFEPTHPLYSKANHRVLGKLKSETGSVAPREFVGLRAKMYSLHVLADKKQSKITAKGIKKSYVNKNVCHEHFLNTLKTQQSTFSRFCAFWLHNHVLQTVEVNMSLNAFDDKRYILEDGVATLAYGHKNLRHEWLTVELIKLYSDMMILIVNFDDQNVQSCKYFHTALIDVLIVELLFCREIYTSSLWTV